MMKPNIKDRFFILQCNIGRLQLYTKSCFDPGGDCFMDVLVEFLSYHSIRYCNGVRSFINQAHKYPKQSTTYSRQNSIALLHFIVINQHMVLQRNAGFKCQALKTPKMNLTGISLQNVAISLSLTKFRFGIRLPVNMSSFQHGEQQSFGNTK